MNQLRLPESPPPLLHRKSAIRTRTMAASAALTLALLATVVSGCGAPAVDPPDLDVEVPARWTESSAAELDWWSSFPGEQAQALVGEALRNNHNLAVAASRLDAAAAESRIAAADLYPQLAAGADAARSRQVFVGLPIPGREGPLVSRSTSYGVSASASWELDLWGRLRQRSSAAAAEVAATAADYDGARLSLAGQALKAWFAATEAELQWRLAGETDSAHARTVQGIRDRYRAGVRPAIDLRMALVDQANARVALEQRRVARDRTLRQLELLLGRYPGARLELTGDLPTAPAPVPDDLQVDLLTRRPDLVAAERRLAAAGRRVSESKRALLPQIRLTASGGTASDQLEDLVDGDFSVWRIAAGLLQPVFQGGRLRAQVTRAGANEDAALAQWANAVLTACGEVESALVSERALAEQERAATVAAEQARGALDLARSRYDSGLDGILTLLSAQRADSAAQGALLQIRRLRLEARVHLHLALGGGFTLPTPREEGDPS